VPPGADLHGQGEDVATPRAGRLEHWQRRPSQQRDVGMRGLLGMRGAGGRVRIRRPWWRICGGGSSAGSSPWAALQPCGAGRGRVEATRGSGLRGGDDVFRRWRPGVGAARRRGQRLDGLFPTRHLR
jgi:hypothetical protein